MLLKHLILCILRTLPDTVPNKPTPFPPKNALVPEILFAILSDRNCRTAWTVPSHPHPQSDYTRVKAKVKSHCGPIIHVIQQIMLAKLCWDEHCLHNTWTLVHLCHVCRLYYLQNYKSKLHVFVQLKISHFVALLVIGKELTINNLVTRLKSAKETKT